MQAIILAAGMGTRLGALTAENTKCMVSVNGVTLIERLLRQLDGLSLSRIVIVTGWQSRTLRAFIQTLPVSTKIVFVENTLYDKTNNIYSLYLARSHLASEDTLLFESDLILEDGIVASLVSSPHEVVALVDRYAWWMDGTVVTLSDGDEIVDVIPKKKFSFADCGRYYKTVNVYKFSAEFSRRFYVPFLESYIHAMGNSQYYENVLRILTVLDSTGIYAMRLSGRKWYEIDDVQDLEIASALFASPEQKVRMFRNSYGGFWRFPDVLDFCYLVNPYYPPKRLLLEMQESMPLLVTQYPSGMARNCMLAAKNFCIQEQSVAVGNGAAELIKALLSFVRQKTDAPCGFIRPTFEEYPNRCTGDAVVMHASYPDFSYSADDVISFFAARSVAALFLINPDNPSGTYIPKADVLRIASWAEEQGVRLVVDESFCDFADEEHNSLLDDAVLGAYPHLVVIKSISKSYGVPGIRLGVLASMDRELVQAVRSDAAIWNINSLAEFYMQIAGKYKAAYESSLVRYRAERRRFVRNLSAVPYLRVIDSQANFVMCELLRGTSSALTHTLLSEHDIFIKDVTEKIADGRHYVRLAVRSEKDNDVLVNALHRLEV